MAKTNKLILGKCEYDPELRSVTTEDHPPQVIGHVQAKLLQLLYSNPNVYFSNDDLQKEVWDGRYIENTTIRTTVSYLRKALGESEECKYIDSGRNKGYRFIADIEEITPKRQLKKILPFFVIALLATVLIYIEFQTVTPQGVPQIQTTLLGQELEATVSRGVMVFSHKPEGSQYWNLYSKEIGTERYHRLTNGSFNDRNASLSDDGSWIAFNRHDGKSCTIIVARLARDDQTLASEKTVFSCPEELLSVSTAWKDNNNLYLSLYTSISKSYAVYLLNIETGKSKAITSPSLSGRGDYFVTAKNEVRKIAYLRNVMGTKTEIWIYDEQTKKSNKLASVPLILMSVGWINTNKLVVRTGYGQLSSLDIHSGKLQTIFETDDSINFPYTINENTIGYMKGLLTVKDIIQLQPNGISNNVISSSFGDYSPVYAEDVGIIVFISNRTGRNQIWLLNKDGELSQITRFEKNARIGNLAVSPNGRYIAFVINADLYIVGADGLQKFKSQENHLYKNPVFSANSETIFYTSNIDSEWFIESRLMSNLSQEEQITNGYVIIPCIDSDCFYFIKNKESDVYKSVDGLITSTGVELKDISRPDQTAIIGDFIYYLNRDGNKSELLLRNMNTKEVTNVMPLPDSRFAIQLEPLRVFTSISREPETFLQSITVED